MKRPIQHHPFQPGYVDESGTKPRTLCLNCEMPEHNQRHKLPATSTDAKALDARRLGEST